MNDKDMMLESVDIIRSVSDHQRGVKRLLVIAITNGFKEEGY